MVSRTHMSAFTKTCLRSKANPNALKTFDSCTLRVQSGPNGHPVTSTNSRQFVPVPANNSFRLADTGEWTRYA